MGDEVEYAVVGKQAIDGEYTAVKYVDWTIPEDAEALASFDQWHLESFAAATRNRFGKGTAYYVGAVVSEPAFYDQLIADVLNAGGVSPVLAPPEGVEVSVREGAGKKLLFLVNHTEEKQQVSVPSGKPELLTDETTSDTVTLDAYGVAVIKLG